MKRPEIFLLHLDEIPVHCMLISVILSGCNFWFSIIYLGVCVGGRGGRGGARGTTKVGCFWTEDTMLVHFYTCVKYSYSTSDSS